MTSELSVKISEESNARIKVVVFKGEMDETNIEHVRAQIAPFLDDASIKTIIFHFKNLNFINSKGIGYLVSVHTHLAKDKRRLVLAEAQEPVMDVINLIGLTGIIPYFETLEEALAS